MLLAPNFFWGRAPKLLDPIYQIQEPSDHVAKFRAIGRRSSEISWRKKETSAVNISPPGTTVPGGLIIIQDLYNAMESEDTEAHTKIDNTQ